MQHVLQTGHFVLGEEVERFESDFARFIGVRHAIGVGTGLAAIELALAAHGIGPGDEVITAANTFIATVLAISAVGARPVLVDIDPLTYTLDPSAVDAAITSRTRAVVPVHLYGHPVDLDGISAVAKRNNLLIVEDSDADAELVVRELRLGGVLCTQERVDTRAGWQNALAQHSSWDIVLLDHALPGMNTPTGRIS